MVDHRKEYLDGLAQIIKPTERGAVAVMHDFAPCPVCKQYSHSIGNDFLAEAHLHFETMFSHRGDDIPTQHLHDEKTRDMAQRLIFALASARQREAAEAPLRAEIAAKDAEIARLRDALSKAVKLMDRAADWIDQDTAPRGPAEDVAHTRLIKALELGIDAARAALAGDQPAQEQGQGG